MSVRPEDVAPEYFRCVREKDAEGISRLFSPDAVRISFQGHVADGHAAVLDWYLNRDFKQEYIWHLADGTVLEPPAGDAPVVGSLTPLLPGVVAGNRCAVEVAVELADGSRYRALDLFTLDEDGRVAQLLVYRGPHVPD
jgi:hypothetical protein